MSTVLIASLPFSSMAHPLVYSITVVAAVGIIGSQYALMPSAVTDTFGEKYASMNIGLVYMSTVSLPKTVNLKSMKSLLVERDTYFN